MLNTTDFFTFLLVFFTPFLPALVPINKWSVLPSSFVISYRSLLSVVEPIFSSSSKWIFSSRREAIPFLS
ncbi:MAG TPA: hypothetical protein DDY76_07730 [Opitutae bacterium]|nr:hypothetical protein [Opitutae bacterium]